MRIAIEALGIDRPGGGRSATLNLLKPLLQLDTQNEYIIYLTQPELSLAGLRDNMKQRIIPIRNRFLARMLLQAILPVEARRLQVSLVHFVKNQVVLGTGTRTIATVYDFTTLRYPAAYPQMDVWYWRHVLPRQLRRIDRLVAISESTASDLVAYYGISRERIEVIYPGFDPVYRVATSSEVEASRRQYDLLDTEYFIHVGNLSLKKNLAMLLDAFIDFRQRCRFTGKLVLVGMDYSKGRDDRFISKINQREVHDAVRIMGYVPSDLLVGLYGGALGFLFPSLHEGFGIAPLEAMACGAPVVVHGAGAVGEVVSDAGLVLDSATDVNLWSQTIETIAFDPRLRQRLRQAGLDRAEMFAAKATARRTIELYEQVALMS